MELLTNLTKDLLENYKCKADNDIFETGFTNLDNILNIKKRKNLIVISGRPGMGKTNLALNISSNFIKKNIPVALFSLDLSKEQCAVRLLSAQSMIETQNIAKNKIRNQDVSTLKLSSNEFENYAKLEIDDTPGICIEEIKEKSRKLKLENNIELIVIDYLQLINTKAKFENEEKKISYISKSIKIMAKELDVNIIITTQLPKDIDERENHRPCVRDLLNTSRAIAETADEIIFIYRDNYYNKDSQNKNLAEICVDKNKYGNISNTELLFLPQYSKYLNI